MKILFRGRISLSPAYVDSQFPLPFEETSVPYNNQERAPWANSINYIPLRRNCTPYVFDFKGVSSSRVAISRVHASHDPMLSRRGEKEIRWSPRDPRQLYKIRELHFRKEGRDPDEDPVRNRLLTEAHLI